jgi:uncharacterized membrane protein
MEKKRLESFSDGVIAIIITVMVLELKVPHGDSLYALRPLIPKLISYVLSFIYIGIYWNNHHHLFYAVQQVDGPILLANQHLLFWLSLIPFVTDWMGENNFSAWPVALYGMVLLLSNIAYYLLSRLLIKHHKKNSALSLAIGNDFKGKVSMLIYVVAVLVSFVNSWIAFALYVSVAVIWFIPDRRIEKKVDFK